ncbi:hypothetical protein DWV37_09070 [Tannerella sp. AF04-6]|nr:hypothetical protein DW107_08050 [Tannerella sp. AM09-19]RHS45681.1 hypothetical protein DWV37_09070 [Tannerella sp. AF04-6]
MFWRLSNFSNKNTIRSSLRFLPVCFPFFTHQIARYPPHKNDKTYSKKLQNLTRAKFRLALKEYSFNQNNL